VHREPNFVSINATTEVDLMTGGQRDHRRTVLVFLRRQADFARGAMYSPGGMAFLVLHSHDEARAAAGFARSDPRSVVTTLKNTVDHIVTEYGVAALRGASIDEGGPGASSPSPTPTTATNCASTRRQSRNSALIRGMRSGTGIRPPPPERPLAPGRLPHEPFADEARRGLPKRAFHGAGTGIRNRVGARS